MLWVALRVSWVYHLRTIDLTTSPDCQTRYDKDEWDLLGTVCGTRNALQVNSSPGNFFVVREPEVDHTQHFVILSRRIQSWAVLLRKEHWLRTGISATPQSGIPDLESADVLALYRIAWKLKESTKKFFVCNQEKASMSKQNIKMSYSHEYIYRIFALLHGYCSNILLTTWVQTNIKVNLHTHNTHKTW